MSTFTPVNSTEKTLTILPKECSCNMCQSIKKDALNTLGTKRFNEVCKILKIAA